MLIGLEQGLHENFGSRLVYCVETIGSGFIRPKHTKILRVGIAFHDVAQKLAKDTRSFAQFGPWLWNSYFVIAKVRHEQVAKQEAAVCLWIGAHSAVAFRCQFREFSVEFAGFIEQLFGFVALHPFFENLYVRGM